MPKLVAHSFESLAGALPRQPASGKPMVWSTFHDIRRFGGLQIHLIARRSALQRMPEPLDVANSIVYLLGEGGRNITGTVITIDAGNTA